MSIKHIVKSNRAEKTYEGVALVSKKLLAYFSPVRTIDTITLKDAEDFLDSLKKTAPKAVYNYHRVLRAMFNKAVQWNYLSSNVFEKIKLPKRQAGKPSYITETELQKIIGCNIPVIVRQFVITAFYTGCRLGELVNLRWENVNLKENIITIGDKNFTTKTRKQRIIPIHPRVAEVLSELQLSINSKRSNLSGHPHSSVISKRSQPAGWRSEDPDLSGHHPGTVILNSFQDLNSKRSLTSVRCSLPADRHGEDPGLSGQVAAKNLPNHSFHGYVFAKSNSLPYTKDYFSRNFKRACRKAGIDEDIHFHSLRHSAATGMINKGAPVPSVQKILGHANIATTMLYTHPDLNSLRDAISRL